MTCRYGWSILRPPLAVAHVPTRAAPKSHGVCLLRSIRTVKARLRAAQFESLGPSLSRHRAVTRVSAAALSFTILIALSYQATPAQAGYLGIPVSGPYKPSHYRY